MKVTSQRLRVPHLTSPKCPAHSRLLGTGGGAGQYCFVLNIHQPAGDGAKGVGSDPWSSPHAPAAFMVQPQLLITACEVLRGLPPADLTLFSSQTELSVLCVLGSPCFLGSSVLALPSA